MQSTIAATGARMAQHAVDTGLRQLESRLSQRFFRTINLNWSPGFNGREDLYQVDAMTSLYDGQRGSLLSQLGLQSRDGETGANVGAILRSRAFEHWTFGVNAFYDYLSEPEVDRWSAGVEMLGRWFSVSGNIYTGLDEDLVNNNTYYSPDGWDLELAGVMPSFPWLELAGRYYHWDRTGQSDLKGQDYKLTLSPVPMLGVSLRYDDVSAGGGSLDTDIGFELNLSYEMGRPFVEQLRAMPEPGVGTDPWQRRFERVRREYEQRVQRRGAGGVRAAASCGGSSCLVTLTLGSVPSDTTSVVVAARVSPSLGATSSASGNGDGNDLLRTARRCQVTGLAGASCDYDGGSTVRVNLGNVGSGSGGESYGFRVGFRDSANMELGSASVAVTLPMRAAGGITYSTPVVTVNEGGTATYTVVLNNEPTGTVTVALASSNTNAVTVSPASLTFTTANWNMAQTVTVTGVEETGANANTVSETAQISYSVSGGGYDNLAPAAQRAVVSDNDGASVTSTAAATVALTEGGALATYTLVLNSQPSAAVTITPLSSDVGAVTVAPASLSFSTTNWNTAQTVMVSPVDDGDAADESASISYAISGGDYASVTLASQQVTVDDDETAGLTSTGGSSVAVTEGRTTTYTLVLTSQPSASVTIALASSNTSALTVSPASLSFTPANWNTAQTVTVTGVEETGGNANSVSETVSISYTISGGDYASVTLAAQSVAVTDNDIPGVSSTASATVALTEGGSAATYTIVLNAQPTAAVTVAISSGDTGAVTVAPASLMFSTSNWSAAQTVTVTPVQDSDAANESVSISYAVSGGNYATAGVTLAAQTVTVADDETAGITSTGAASIAVTEEGAVVTYTIVLNTQPTGTVTVALASDDTTSVTVSPASLSFGTSTWNTTQNVMVTAVADADAASERVSINYTVSGGDYASVTLAPQPVAVTDNDTAGLTSTAAATVALTEGGAAGTYTIVLDTQPSAAVTVALSSSDTGAVTVSPASLSFSASTWNTAQTVTVTAVADGNAADESVTISYTVSGGDYATVTLASQRGDGG